MKGPEAENKRERIASTEASYNPETKIKTFAGPSSPTKIKIPTITMFSGSQDTDNYPKLEKVQKREGGKFVARVLWTLFAGAVAYWGYKALMLLPLL